MDQDRDSMSQERAGMSHKRAGMSQESAGKSQERAGMDQGIGLVCASRQEGRYMSQERPSPGSYISPPGAVTTSDASDAFILV